MDVKALVLQPGLESYIMYAEHSISNVDENNIRTTAQQAYRYKILKENHMKTIFHNFITLYFFSFF